MTLQYAVTTRKVQPLKPKYFVTQHLYITAPSGNHIKYTRLLYYYFSSYDNFDNLMLYMYISFFFLR